MVFGMGHPEAGYMLAEHWELPHELSEPIRFHITPERAKEFPQQSAIVALAARLTECHLMNISEPAEIFTDFEDCLSLLGLTQEQLVTVLAEITIDAA
jgi:HD-like signal output (HDOD) protein